MLVEKNILTDTIIGDARTSLLVVFPVLLTEH